jgi:hypothetical protein
VLLRKFKLFQNRGGACCLYNVFFCGSSYTRLRVFDAM